MQLESAERLHDQTPQPKIYEAPRLLEFGAVEELTRDPFPSIPG